MAQDTPPPAQDHPPSIQDTAAMAEDASPLVQDTAPSTQNSVATMVQDSEVTMAQDTQPAPTKKIFPFFSLARELRDEIYEGLIEHKTMFKDPTLNCTLESSIESMLLVCRQFNKEYRSRVERYSTLVIEGGDVFYDYVDHGLGQIPKEVAARLTHLEATFSDWEGQGFSLADILEDMDLLKDRFINKGIAPRLRSWEIKNLVSKICFERFVSEPEKANKRFEEDDNLTTIEVLARSIKHFEDHDKLMKVEVSPAYTQSPEVLARWTREKGLEVLHGGLDLLPKIAEARSRLE